MFDFVHIWQALAGLATFMLGIHFMEESLRKLAGREFKLLLKKHASHRLRAAASGAIVSAILQSSSAVNLITLAFVGSGILELSHALGIILGSNLGTTVTGWMVAGMGFRFDLAFLAYPLISAGGLMWLLLPAHHRSNGWGKVFLGAGFLFLGLALMKLGVEKIFNQPSFLLSTAIPLWVFLLTGLFFTAAVQSSSATVAIVLSLLHAGEMEMKVAAAIVLGAEIGTAIKLIPASFGGNAVKQRVAAGSIAFNLIPALLIFLFLNPILNFFQSLYILRDPLIQLVAFQTSVNLLGLICFLPFLKGISAVLEKKFTKPDTGLKFLTPTVLADITLSVEAFKSECHSFCIDNIDFSLRCFGEEEVGISEEELHRHYQLASFSAKYETIKQLHGKIRDYYFQISRLNDIPAVTVELDRLVRAIRNGMYAAKNMKDVLHNIEQLRNSSNNSKYQFYCDRKERHLLLCHQLLQQLRALPSDVREMKKIYLDITGDYEKTLQFLYGSNIRGILDEAEISTLVNFNREVVSAQKSLFFAVKDIVFPEAMSESLEHLPGFIR